MRHVEEMSREEVIADLRDKVLPGRMDYLIHWSTPSLKALLILSREQAKGEREDRVHPQLGITLALRITAVLADEKELKN